MQCNDGTGKNVVSFDFRIVEKSLNTSQAKVPELGTKIYLRIARRRLSSRLD